MTEVTKAIVPLRGELKGRKYAGIRQRTCESQTENVVGDRCSSCDKSIITAYYAEEGICSKKVETLVTFSAVIPMSR